MSLLNNVGNNQPPQELVQDAEKEGRKLGLLIASLPISDENKEALLNLLPHFTPEQLFRFSAVLESAYLNKKTEGVDKELEQIISQIQDEYQNKVQTAESTAAKAMDDLAKEIK